MFSIITSKCLKRPIRRRESFDRFSTFCMWLKCRYCMDAYTKDGLKGITKE